MFDKLNQKIAGPAPIQILVLDRDPNVVGKPSRILRVDRKFSIGDLEHCRLLKTLK